MSYTARAARILVILVTYLLPVPGAEAESHCQLMAGRLVSLQGQAQVLGNGETIWQQVGQNSHFCPGDMLRVSEGGRVAVLLANQAVVRIDQNSTLKFGQAEAKKSSFMELLQGILHIFSHRRNSLNISTPYVNGAVEGTEFLVQSDTGSSTITVFEGLVKASNKQGSLAVAGGQTVIAVKGTAPKYMEVVKPRDGAQWTLYYPRILDTSTLERTPGLSQYLQRASNNLAVGQVSQARQNIAAVLVQDPANSEALALLAIIEVVQNNREEALSLATSAVAANPKSAAANLALSYTQQALFDIAEALATLERAESFNPDNGEIKARLAELQLSVGDLDTAMQTAQAAVKLNPDIARAQAVLGFAHLSRTETAMARKAFDRAIALNPALPLARLGLGLAKIRQGNLAEGRTEIEIAAALDPDNSLIRSYLGKAYYEEKRESQARRQYQIAKKLDPADPTPWFYDALLKQSGNRPVEALQDLQQSIALNDNRAVYRSRLLLDSDIAARSVSLGRIYNDLGFNKLARVTAFRSVQKDPSNFSAHRFLSDSSSALPRHEIARTSELLQSQLLQPININPVQPQLAEGRVFNLEVSGPSVASFNEFNPLFLMNRTSLLANAVAGSNNLFGDELVLSGVHNNFSYSLGQLYYQTDGIRENNDQQNYIYNAFFQGMLSPTTSLLTEIRYGKQNYGDIYLNFDPSDYSSTLQQSDETKSIRLGARHDIKPKTTLLGTIILGRVDADATGIQRIPLTVDINNEADNVMAELQHIYQSEGFNIRSGAGFLSVDDTNVLTFTLPIVGSQENSSKIQHANLYSYGQVDLGSNLTATLGLSGDWLDNPVKDGNELNPKLGLTWQPAEGTLIRAAAFRNTTRNFFYGQTIEPTTVAGFNQFFDDFETSSAWTYGVGGDTSFADNWYAGLQLFHRDLDVPFSNVNPNGIVEQIEDNWQEDIGSAYLYWAPALYTTLGLEYSYENFYNDTFSGPQGTKNLTTHRLSPQLRFFHPTGISATARATFIDQQVEYFQTIFSLPEDSGQDSDQFWVVDLSVSYRLPQRYGIFTLEVRNLFDEQFNFLDTDPRNPEILQGQQIIGSLTLSF
jgi:tetratricopeptide (TPR) repeat protein